MDFSYRIALPEDKELLASGAEGSFSFMAGDIADVNVLQTGLYSDLTILFQGGDWRGREVAQFVKGVESRKVNWCFYAQFVLDPGAHLAHRIRVVILGGDDQVGDFYVDPFLP